MLIGQALIFVLSIERSNNSNLEKFLAKLDVTAIIIGFAARLRIGRMAGFALMRIPGSLVPRERADHDVDAASDQLRLEILVAVRGDFIEEFVYYLKTNFRVRHFASAKLEMYFDLHILAQESDRVLDFHSEIVRIDLWA